MPHRSRISEALHLISHLHHLACPHSTQLALSLRTVDARSTDAMVLPASTQWERLETALRRMHEAGAATTLEQYDVLVSAHKKGERWGDLDRVMRQMSGAGLKPRMESYDSLINAYEKQSQVSQCLLRQSTRWLILKSTTT